MDLLFRLVSCASRWDLQTPAIDGVFVVATLRVSGAALFLLLRGYCHAARL